VPATPLPSLYTHAPTQSILERPSDLTCDTRSKHERRQRVQPAAARKADGQSRNPDKEKPMKDGAAAEMRTLQNHRTYGAHSPAIRVVIEPPSKADWITISPVRQSVIKVCEPADVRSPEPRPESTAEVANAESN
jgi:hypothetical protein